MFCAYTTPLHIRDLTFQEGLVPVVPEANPPPVQRDDQLQTFGLFHDGGCSLVSSGSLWLSCPTLWDQGLSRYSMNSELTILTYWGSATREPLLPQSDSSLLPSPFLEVLLGHCILKLPRTIQELSYQYNEDSYMTKEIPSLRVSVSQCQNPGSHTR